MLRRMPTTMRAALTHYGKQKCMMVIDRDGAGYEVGMLWAQPSFTPAIADILNGQKLFRKPACCVSSSGRILKIAL
jgi:hypothetical protein